ncbi:MAG: hypothetical protein EHM67_18920 [Hyphomicrobiaceae bacterium]|nr:MAG: hypothetical protein EHM67_18920 [Hyphomicrobiaceae bacterium]
MSAFAVKRQCVESATARLCQSGHIGPYFTLRLAVWMSFAYFLVSLAMNATKLAGEPAIAAIDLKKAAKQDHAG